MVGAVQSRERLPTERRSLLALEPDGSSLVVLLSVRRRAKRFVSELEESLEEADHMNEPKLFPIQHSNKLAREHLTVPEPVYMAAYEVYSEVFSPQDALIRGDCRGGFGIGELTAFLYARAFPRKEWRTRVDEAFRGMNL